MTIIKVESCDGEVICVNLELAKCSTLIKDMEKDLGWKGTEDPVPLPNVKAAILRMIINWATHHKDDPPQEDYDEDNKERRTDDITSFDAAFLAEMDEETLYDLMMTANYLDIEGLLDLTCKAFAGMIKQKTPKQIREVLNMENDLTAEQEAQIQKENDFCEEK